MTRQQQTFDAKREETINEMMPFEAYPARGDSDLKVVNGASDEAIARTTNVSIRRISR